ncbi:hypothetical protein [Streptomyces sp. NPDC060366]|uniref:hypothetical protein n=1 Tax=Streptomyces sp. NPDC060366 TaxID=3347105 RepID=UPI003652F097
MPDMPTVIKTTPTELRAQRAQLIASTGLTESVLGERGDAFQLYPEHAAVWETVKGIDYLLAGEVDEPHVGQAAPSLTEMVTMSNEQSREDWAGEQHLRAQDRAVHWADRAVLEHEEAEHHLAAARDLARKPFSSDLVSTERTQAREHAELSTGARQLAEMWAQVAESLLAR